MPFLLIFSLSVSYLFYKQTGGFQFNGFKICRGTQTKVYRKSPEGMTAKLVKDMADSDLLDMHFFLIEDDDLEDDEFEEGFYIF